MKPYLTNGELHVDHKTFNLLSDAGRSATDFSPERGVFVDNGTLATSIRSILGDELADEMQAYVIFGMDIKIVLEEQTDFAAQSPFRCGPPN